MLVANSNETTTWDECECGYKTNFDDNDITSSIAYLDRYNKYLLKADGTSIKANKGNYWDGAENIVTVENQSEVKYGETSGYAMKIGFDLSKFTEEQLTEATTEATSSWAGWDKKQLWVAYAIPVEALNLNTVTITLDAKFDNMDQQITIYAAQNAPEGAEYVYAVGAEYTVKQANATELEDGWYRYTYTVKSTYAVDKAADYIVLSLSNTNAQTTDTTKPSYAYIDNVAITDRECAHDSETATAATCTKAAFCDLCDKSFGDVNAENHEKEITITDNGDTHTMKYECCGAETTAAHEGTWVVGEGKDVLTCECGKALGEFNTTNSLVELNLNIENAADGSEAALPIMTIIDNVEVASGNFGAFIGIIYNGEVIFSEQNMDNMTMLDGQPALKASIFGYAYGEVVLEYVFTDKINGTEHKIQVPVMLITNVIETKEELDNFPAVAALCEADENTWGGYFKLGANIIYNDNLVERTASGDLSKIPNKWNSAWATPETTNGFIGTFDGQGYAIDGLLVYDGGFIPALGADGVLTNVAFTNVAIGSKGSIVGYNNGLVENIYVHVYVYGIFWGHGGTVDAPTWCSYTYYNPGTTGSNTGIINNTAWNATGTINNMYVDMTDSAKTMQIETKIWTGWSWLNHANYVQADGTTKVVNSIRLFGLSDEKAPHEGVYAVGFPAEDSESVKFVTKVPETEIFARFVDYAAFKAAYSAENSAVAAEIATWPAWLASYAAEAVALNNAKIVDLGISVNSGSLVQSNATATIDLSEIGEDIGALTSVTWKGKPLSATLSGTTLSVPVAQFGYEFGESNLTVIVEKGKYSLPIILATKVLNTAADVDAFDEIAIAMGNLVYNRTDGKLSTGYFALGQNISYNGTYVAAQARGSSSSLSWDAGAAAGFAGVFDGCGYTIDGMTVGSSVSATNNAAFISLLHADGIVRNVGFTNATIDNTGCAGFVIGVGQGLVENVYVQLVAVPHYSVVGGIAATDNARCVSGPTVRNVFVDSSAFTTNTTRVYAIGGTSGDFCNNTTGASGADEVTDKFGIYDGAYALVADCGATNHLLTNAFGAGGAYSAVNTGAYASAEAMKADTAAQAELATWSTAYWTIGENGVPVWNSAK